MRMEQMYQDVILDHYKHPHGRGLREPFGAEVHHVNPTCGDEVTLRVHLSDDGKVVEDISYDGQGCSISQAATSVLHDQVVGQKIDDALATVTAFNTMMTSRGTDAGDEDVVGDGIAFSGVSKYPARVKCALLGWLAFKDALVQTVGAADAAPVAGQAADGQAVGTQAVASQATDNTSAVRVDPSGVNNP